VFSFGSFLFDLVFPQLVIGVVPATGKMSMARGTTDIPALSPAWCGVDLAKIRLLYEVGLTFADDDEVQKLRGRITNRMLVAAALVNIAEAQSNVWGK
jgi:hypothetical protein